MGSEMCIRDSHTIVESTKSTKYKMKYFLVTEERTMRFRCNLVKPSVNVLKGETEFPNCSTVKVFHSAHEMCTELKLCKGGALNLIK